MQIAASASTVTFEKLTNSLEIAYTSLQTFKQNVTTMKTQDVDRKTRKNDGKEFEERIFNLLRLNGAEALTREKQFRSQKADIYFERELLGKRRRYAVECKDHAGTLTKENLSSIKSRYEGLFKENDITDLLVVSNQRLAAGARSYVDSIPTLSFQTEADLRNSIIDFNSHLIGIQARLESSDVKNYYLAPFGTLYDTNGALSDSAPSQHFRDLEELLMHQLANGTGPTVVLGAYGIGKTTLALNIFSKLAKKYSEHPGALIPIYIPLDLMQREQSLDGLLGTVFTSLSQCKGYNYDLFRRMNRDGNFVLLLDGFDEMRHKLNKDDFLHNIDQLSQLSAENPRTLLLGRPSAFMDESEYEYVVRGRDVVSLGLSLTKYHGYEAQISQLEPQQIVEFTRRYCLWKYHDRPQKFSQITDLLAQKKNTVLRDIVTRPVQLMMFLEIFPELPKRIDSVTKATVYSLFISKLIDREKTEKRSRLLSKADQLKFAQEIAWWLWLSQSSKSVRANQIPDHIFEEFVRSDETIEDVRRALVAGSFLSSEGGTRLHFPHNSIQEFLVASKFCDALSDVDRIEVILPELAGNESKILTPDVVDFLAAQIGKTKIQRMMQYIDQVRSIPQSLVRLLEADENVSHEVSSHFSRTGSVASGWILVAASIMGLPISAATNAALGIECKRLIKNCVERYARDLDYTEQRAHGDVANYLLCIFVLTSSNQYDERSGFAAEALGHMIKFGRATSEKVMSTRKSSHSTTRRSIEFHPFASELLNRLKSFVFTSKIDIQWIYKYLRSQSPDSPIIREWIVGDTLRLPNQKLRTEFDQDDKPDFYGIKLLIEKWHKEQQVGSQGN